MFRVVELLNFTVMYLLSLFFHCLYKICLFLFYALYKTVKNLSANMQNKESNAKNSKEVSELRKDNDNLHVNIQNEEIKPKDLKEAKEVEDNEEINPKKTKEIKEMSANLPISVEHTEENKIIKLQDSVITPSEGCNLREQTQLSKPLKLQKKIQLRHNTKISSNEIDQIRADVPSDAVRDVLNTAFLSSRRSSREFLPRDNLNENFVVFETCRSDIIPKITIPKHRQNMGGNEINEKQLIKHQELELERENFHSYMKLRCQYDTNKRKLEKINSQFDSIMRIVLPNYEDRKRFLEKPNIITSTGKEMGTEDIISKALTVLRKCKEMKKNGIPSEIPQENVRNIVIIN